MPPTDTEEKWVTFRGGGRDSHNLFNFLCWSAVFTGTRMRRKPLGFSVRGLMTFYFPDVLTCLVELHNSTHSSETWAFSNQRPELFSG